MHSFLKNNKFLTAGAVTLMGLFVLVFILLEINESRNNLLSTVEDESLTLVGTLSGSIEMAVYTNIEVENLLIDKLNAGAGLAGQVAGMPGASVEFEKIADEFGIPLIMAVNVDGAIIAANDPGMAGGDAGSYLQGRLRPLFEGEYRWLDLGYLMSPDSSEMYMLARRTSPDICIAAGIDAGKLLEFRREIGIGRKIRDIGANPGIVYAVLQDTIGIIAASEKITEMTPIISDSFLLQAWNSGRTKTRITNYSGKEILEAVKSIRLEDGTKMLNRIGLSLETVNDIQQRAVTRAVLIGVGIFITGAFMTGFLLNREKLLSLRTRHEQAKNYIETLLNGINDAVIAVDREMNIVVFNNTAGDLCSKNAADVQGRPYSEVFPEDEMLLSKAVENGGKLPYSEKECTGFKSETKIVGISISTVRGPKSEFNMVLAIVRDLTEQRRLTEKLNRREKLSAMGELAAGVAHEIRNPLNAINVIIQRFQYEFEPKEDAEEYMQLAGTVRAEVDRVNSIIRQFLEFARPKKIEPAKFNIADLFDETKRIMSSQAATKHIRLEDHTESDFEIIADREKMKQVMLNLVQNSIDAISSGGLIIFEAEAEGQTAILRIKDNGAGIPEEEQKHVFDLYFSAKPGGTGLGLSIVDQIISEHGGEISIDSAPGKGTTITIQLPLNRNLDKKEE